VALAAFLLLLIWCAVSCTRNAAETAEPERYVGTWEIKDMRTRNQEGISFLMIERDGNTEAGSNFVVATERGREVFRFRDGRLIHDTVTILYDDARDTIRHSSLGELIRKPQPSK
jgi:hypothetical protein